MTKLEKAAEAYYGSFKWKRDTDQTQKYCIDAFKAGAEWQSKQSPWISVEERLPEENRLVLCRMTSNRAIISGYIFISPDNLPCVATCPDFEFEDRGGYVCDMWMPIPADITKTEGGRHDPESIH